MNEERIRSVAVTTAAFLPITLEEVKDHLNIERGETVYDEYLKHLSNVAVESVQDYTGMKLITSVWYSYHDSWGAEDHIELPHAPLQSISSTGVTYSPSTGGTSTFSSTAWRADTVNKPPRLVLKYDDDWPSEQLDNSNPVRIKATYGYTTSGKVPSSLKQAMFCLIGNWFEHRESIVMGVAPAEIPGYIRSMMDRYRVRYVA